MKYRVQENTIKKSQGCVDVGVVCCRGMSDVRIEGIKDRGYKG
jgi:hypothetical protein